MLEGVAHVRLGDGLAGNACFDQARRASKGDVTLCAEIAYQRAVSAWIQRDLKASEKILDDTSSLFADAAGAGDRDILVLVSILRGVIAGSRGDFASQGAALLEGLRAVGDRATSNVYYWATIAEQIASLARELPSPTMRAAALDELPRIPWTEDIAQLRFLMLRSIGWCHALEGDAFNAFRRLRQAATVAPSDACRVMAFCDRSYLASTLGEPLWSIQERSDAHELAERVDWQKCRGDERAALVLLAELFANEDQAVALSYLAQYRASRSSADRLSASHDDRRVDAMEAYSFGVVQQARGNRVEAVRHFTLAWDVYDAIGYEWRAGRVARALSDITGDEVWKKRASEKLRTYGRGWLKGVPQNLETADSQGDALRLSSAQALVFDGLLRGLSNAAIAKELKRSEFTVRNHVKAIFRAYGVHSRSALIAQCGSHIPGAPRK